ncbi:hypothetical protein ACFL3S_09655 [Gemmatimonadota bacterium]
MVRIHPGQFLLFSPGTRRVRAFFLVLLSVLFAARPAAGQTTGTRADSADLRREAREAQRRFESIHRRRLPETREDWGGECDERLGRICLRFQGGSGWEPQPEDSAVIVARRELHRVLEEVGRQIPGDRWVLSQRVRYLGDEGRWEEVVRLAEGCRSGPPWWCPGLLGYAHHRAGRPVEALEWFQRSLGAMRTERASRWRDPSGLLEAPAAQWLREPRGLTVAEAVSRVWAMADPLFLAPGNSRLTEHFARKFGAEIYSGSSLTMSIPWSSSTEELLIRYGFPAGWERTRPEMGDLARDIAVVEHHHPDIRGLLPPLDALQDPAGLTEGLWVPVDDFPRSGSAPLEAPLLVEGLGQTAVFRRGDSLLVLASYAPSIDTLLEKNRRPPNTSSGNGVHGSRVLAAPLWEPRPPNRSLDTLAGLFLLPVEQEGELLGAEGKGGEGVLVLMAPTGGYLLSLELWNPAGRWSSRSRHGVRHGAVPPDVPSLSDILLLSPDTFLPADLGEALPRSLSHTALRSGSRVTLAWEVYGLGRRREPLTFRVSLQREEGGLLRRAFERVGLFRRPPSLRLSWSEGGAEGAGPLFRAVDVELPELDPGWYLLKLELDIPYRNSIQAVRRVRAFQ